VTGGPTAVDIQNLTGDDRDRPVAVRRLPIIRPSAGEDLEADCSSAILRCRASDRPVQPLSAVKRSDACTYLRLDWLCWLILTHHNAKWSVRGHT
jgi:hypothetical protein